MFTARPSIPTAPLTTSVPEPERPPLLPDPIPSIPKPSEPFKPPEEPTFLEKPPFLPQPKPISHSPKISPSSIPNPSPSVTTNKQVEPGYPSYGGYLYSIPGYSAFQPVSYPGVVQPNQAPLVQNEPPTNDFVPFPMILPKETTAEEKQSAEVKPASEPPRNPTPVELPKPQTDFEEHFTPEIVPPPSMTSMSESTQSSECKMSITSLTQGSGATVTIPSQVVNKDTKAKPPERYSLKTSIPISKIDLKCVNTPPDTVFQNSMTKKVPVSQPFQSQKPENAPRVEIQSNIVIKTAQEPEVKEPKPCPPNNSISTLINAAEAINKNESQFRKPDPKPIEITNDAKDTPPPFTPQPANPMPRPIFNPINVDSNKVNYSNKPPDGPINEQKNQILFIQNKNPSNPKMLLTIQQPNPQVLLQRTNFESKNLQAPSRLSSQSKKCKEELVNDNGSSSKVVALKRLHQENCDENDFENLITENQIYGNKIVVKEKSQGTQQEQDLKNKVKVDKPIQNETKNVVLHPNFVYLSNVQFPANLMMIKNNPKVTQSTETNIIKPNKISPNENKNSDVTQPVNSNDNSNTQIKPTKPQNVAVSKEIHVLKSNNNVLQTLSNKNTKPDIVFQTTNQKVIMNPQIVYQVPMIVETDNKTNQPFINREFPKFVASNQSKTEFAKPFEPTKPNEKLYIACPYQMDSKLQPKIVITNIRPKVPKVDEVSSLDIYEKKRRLRRLKYLTNRETKDQKTDVKKVQEKVEKSNNIITPEKMKAEIYKEFSNTKFDSEDGNCDSDSDYGEEELNDYNAIIKKYSEKKDEDSGKVEFLSGFRLASKENYKEKQMERQERILRWDSVASAYIAAGRIDRLMHEETQPEFVKPDPPPPSTKQEVDIKENGVDLQRKQSFLSQLKLVQVSSHYKQGYERVWHEILKERKRRDGTTENAYSFKKPRPIDLDPNGQLQILTEIKKCVNENNNLIKKRLDCNSSEQEGDSIKVLAEKNFSELNRLSKMADRSVKIFSGQETRKRDLNPGFDSENIQKPQIKIESKNFTNITIPSLSKIISLKSTQEKSAVTSSQATSMDEPQSSAAGVKEMFKEGLEEGKVQDFSCQTEEVMPWPGIETIMKSYKEYEIARKKEIAELHRRNTALRVECAYVTRSASRDSDQARALLAERQHLAGEENNLRLSVQKLCAAIEAIRRS
ncbi:hypothetical protein ABMA27_009252 [Loxostege sticticalis]|uniref:Uncharacterized protein n=1 Tax=Loxostege sticticalis TaxID=481309 RepID=A0ABR3HAF2_LOXSC